MVGFKRCAGINSFLCCPWQSSDIFFLVGSLSSVLITPIIAGASGNVLHTLRTPSMQTEETLITPAQRSPVHSHSLPRLPSPLPLAIALTEGDTPLSFPAPSVPPATSMISTTLTVAGPSTDNIFSPTNRQSPDEEGELRAQIQKLKDLKGIVQAKMVKIIKFLFFA